VIDVVDIRDPDTDASIGGYHMDHGIGKLIYERSAQNHETT
jgi:hypothetical protein